MTALEILQDCLDRLCVAQKVYQINLNDDTHRQMIALLNEEGKEQCRSFDWQVLVKEVVFPAKDIDEDFADQGAIEDLCHGYDRICNNCIYIDGKTWPLIGPMSIEDRTYSKAGGMVFIDGYYIQNKHLYLTQPTNSTQNIRIAYISRYWAEDEEGKGITKISQDNDTPLLDTRLLTLGVVWRWLSRNGLPYQQEWLNYNAALIASRAADRPHSVLSVSQPRRYNPRRSLIGGYARVWA